jgi:hypothetical protein
MKPEGHEGTILQKSKNYVKFHRLLAKAEADGRLDGKHRCPVCGMRYLAAREADDCCRIED